MFNKIIYCDTEHRLVPLSRNKKVQEQVLTTVTIIQDLICGWEIEELDFSPDADCWMYQCQAWASTNKFFLLTSEQLIGGVRVNLQFLDYGNVTPAKSKEFGFAPKRIVFWSERLTNIVNMDRQMLHAVAVKFVSEFYKDDTNAGAGSAGVPTTLFCPTPMTR